jgi:hypothetical protein
MIVDRINKYNQELKAAYKKRAQDTYAGHLRSRTLKDVKSSKQFYQPFKAKHASGDIPELVVTPDWDNPDAKFGTVDTTPLILNQRIQKLLFLAQRGQTLRRRGRGLSDPQRYTHTPGSSKGT